MNAWVNDVSGSLQDRLLPLFLKLSQPRLRRFCLFRQRMDPQMYAHATD